MALIPINTMLEVDREKFQLRLLKRPLIHWQFHVVKTYPIAVGMIGLSTPRGYYLINTKSKCPDWIVPNSPWAIAAGLVPGTLYDCRSPANPIKARWLGITDPKEGVGIHGIDPAEYDSIGHRASHGCVRMKIPDVIDLYPQVPKYTPVYIV
jgi:lipoprotein-anchoring transpeptidase ErfK/SrfK